VRPVGDTFLASLRDDHLVAAAAELRWPGDTEWVPVPIVGGAITMDRTSAVMRTGQITVPWSLEAGTDLGVDLRELPFGGYCRPYRGLRYGDGTTELCRLGTLRIESVAWRTDETATLELADRMAQVRDEPFQAPYMPTPKPTVTRTGTVADTSPLQITGLATTSDLTVGMAVAGPTVLPGTVITSIDSPTAVTVNQEIALRVRRNAHLVKGRAYLDRMGDVSGITIGMTVTSDTPTDLYPGTTVTAVYNPPRNGRNVLLNQGAADTASRALYFSFGGTTASFSFVFGGNITVGRAAGEIVQAVFGDEIAYQILYDPPYELLNTAYTDSRVDAVLDLARASSAFAFFDANGDFVFTDLPSVEADDSVWTVDAGETGVLVSDVEALDRTGIYNGVIVQGQASPDLPPLQAMVVDDDPESPTRWGGPYGRVVRIEQSSVVLTVAQAQAAAAALLDARLGLSRSIALTAAPNPALEPGDVITVTFEDGRQERHVVDAIAVGLEATAAQQLTTRSRWRPGDDDWTPLPTPSRAVYVGDAAWELARTARVVKAGG
jgi:hypothetical protein